MGKATKRERQKANRQIKEEKKARAHTRAQAFKWIKGFILIAVLPLVITLSIVINRATNNDSYVAKISVAIDGNTNLPNDGVIEVKLDYVNAPKSVKHFVSFASNGLYNGLSWHRVVKDFVIQGGDPTGTGQGSIGSSVVVELPSSNYKSGDLAWAKASTDQPGTAGSQFFIVTGKDDSPSVKELSKKVPDSDGKQSFQYGFIGKVIRGLGAAVAIEELAPIGNPDDSTASTPTKKAIIKKINIYKNGKLMKPGDVVAATTTPSSTTTIPQTTPQSTNSSSTSKPETTIKPTTTTSQKQSSTTSKQSTTSTKSTKP